MRFHTEQQFSWERDHLCHFGLIEAPLAALIAGGVADLGATAATAGVIGDIGASAVIGGGLGAATSGLTGGNPLLGAATGAFTGGAIGGAGALGLGTAGEALAGGAAGAIGAGVTGQNPLIGAATGAGAGLLSGLSSTPGTSPTGTSSANITGAPVSAGTSAVGSTAGIAPTPGSTPVDLTSGTDFFGGGGTASNAFGISNPAPTPGFSTAGGDAFTATTDAGFTGGNAAQPTGFSGIADKALGFIQKNPAALLGAAPLALSLFGSPQQLPGERALKTAAGEAASQARVLETYQQTGTLPAGLQSAVDRAADRQRAQVRSTYAQLGLSGSTMEAQALNDVAQSSATQMAELAQKLAQQGLSWEQLSAQELDAVLQAQQTQNTAFQNALGNFAIGIAGAAPGINKMFGTGTGS